MRRELFRRPLLVAACALVIGLLARELPWVWLLGALLLIFAPAAGVRGTVLGGLFAGGLLGPTPAPSLSERVSVEGEATVISVPRVVGSGEMAMVQVGPHLFRTTLPLSLEASLGDRLVVSGVAEPIPPSRRLQSARQGVAGLLRIQRATRIDHGPAWWRIGRRWRDSFRACTEQHLSVSARQLADAVCFNVDGGLDDEIRQELQTVGVVHIVSASGLHVGIFAVFLNFVLARLPVDRRIQIVLLLVVLLLYMGATGLRPPVVRAVAMAALIMPSYLWRREGDLLSALGMAAIGNLLLDPRAVWDVGFQLSFVAVFAIGLFPWYPPARREGERPITDTIVQSVWISLVVTIATSPLTAYYFGYVPLIGVVANLVATLPVTMIVVGALAAWSVSWIPFASLAIMTVVEGAATFLLGSVAWMASFPWAAIHLPAFSAGWILVVWAIGLGCWRHRVRPA